MTATVYGSLTGGYVIALALFFALCGIAAALDHRR